MTGVSLNASRLEAMAMEREEKVAAPPTGYFPGLLA